MYKTRHFKLYELVPRQIYESTPRDKDHRLWGLFDDRTLVTADALRDRYGKTTINDWKWGGNNQYGGWRPGDCEIGSELSQHKFGRALDPKFQEVTAEEVREDILTKEYFDMITCVEMDISWLHYDMRNWDIVANGILKVYP